MPKNYGLDLNDTRGPKDWILGGISGMAKDILQPDRNWRSCLPAYENQSFPWGDTMSCVTFSAWNAIETMAKRRYYIDLNKSDRFTAKMSGTTSSGNNFWNVAESITKLHGAVEQASWPNFGATSFADFFREVYVAVVAEGGQWLAGEFVVQREYVNDDVASLWEALQYGPIQVALHAYGPLVNGVYQRTEAQGNHAVLLFSGVDGQYWEIYDHYDNLFKKIAWNTRMWGAMRYDFRRKSEIVPPVSAPVYTFKENFRYFLAAAGGRTLLYAGGKLRLDNLAKILDQWLGRNDGDVKGKTLTISLNELTGVQLYNLKGEPVTLNDNFSGGEPMSKLLEFLKGKKTYVLVALGIVVLALKVGGVLDDKVAADILNALGLGALLTIRLAVAGK